MAVYTFSSSMVMMATALRAARVASAYWIQLTGQGDGPAVLQGEGMHESQAGPE